VFEDVPRQRADTCAAASVVGPVIGVVAALQAALALRLLLGDASAAGELWSYRALEGRVRSHRVARNPSCPLCTGAFTGTPLDRYVVNEA
jgi:adenylyltransferase/sulfurtransferase